MRPETKQKTLQSAGSQRLQPLLQPDMEGVLQKLYPLWQELQISQAEAGFAYQQLCMLPQRATKYIQMLQEAIDLKQRYNIAFNRYKICSRQFGMVHEDSRTALLAVAEFKTQLHVMCQLNQKQRQLTKKETFLPGFDYQSQDVFFQNLVSNIPPLEAVANLLEQAEFCVQSDVGALLREFLQARLKENIGKRQPVLRSAQYAILQLLLGTGLPGNLDYQFRQFMERCLEEYYLVEITSFNPALICKTFANDSDPLPQTQLATTTIKVPFFGTQLPGQQLQAFCGYSKDTARFGKSVLPQAPKAPGYTQYLLARSFTSPSRLSKQATRKIDTSQSGAKQQGIQQQQSTTVLFLRQFYNDGELFLEQQELKLPQGSIQPLQKNISKSANAADFQLESDEDGEVLVIIPMDKQQQTARPMLRIPVERKNVDSKFAIPVQ